MADILVTLVSLLCIAAGCVLMMHEIFTYVLEYTEGRTLKHRLESLR